MDAIDRRILDQLQCDSSQTNQALADKIGLSPSACLKRVNRLRDAGVIEREVALLNPDALGQRLHMVVEVTMERDNKLLYQQFLTSAVNAPEVKQCYQVTGECDFVLIVAVADLDEYDRFCDSVLYSHGNLRKFRTLLSRKRHKFDTSVQLSR